MLKIIDYKKFLSPVSSEFDVRAPSNKKSYNIIMNSLLN